MYCRDVESIIQVGAHGLWDTLAGLLEVRLSTLCGGVTLNDTTKHFAWRKRDNIALVPKCKLAREVQGSTPLGNFEFCPLVSMFILCSKFQSLPEGMFEYPCVCPHTCKIPSQAG